MDVPSKLVMAGFRSIIIRTETGLSRKQVQCLRNRLNVQGPGESGPLPYSESILLQRSRAAEATLFMLNYLNIVNNPDPTCGMDILAVVAAHKTYVENHGALRGGRVDLDCFLEIDDAWVLARDYREQVVTMRPCKTCFIKFVTSIHHTHSNCPLCNGVTVRDEEPASNGKLVKQLIDVLPSLRRRLAWGETVVEVAQELNLSQEEVHLSVRLNNLPAATQRLIGDCSMTIQELQSKIDEMGEVFLESLADMAA